MAAPAVWSDLSELLAAAEGILRIHEDDVEVLDEAGLRSRLIDHLIHGAVFGDELVRSASRWVIRRAAPAVGAYPASIHDLYTAAGRGEYAHATAPAMNIRGMAYDSMRAAFRAAQANDVGIMLFELARSEMAYTEQRPGEYASNALAAAVREGHRGPVFIQGDHYQINAKRYAADKAGELEAVRDLTVEALAAGYFNIDIDASTIVDLSLPTLREQQTLNALHTAELTRFIREQEPTGVTVSIGGEIGEVGLRNSTVEDLHAFMTQYRDELVQQGQESGRELTGISKISVQTGTSHGGIVLPDGSIEQVAVDFETLADLSRVARTDYGMGGAVQHGASTLPSEYFDRFAEANAIEVHLATAFQNIIFDSPALPSDLRDTVYAYLSDKHADERKAGQTDTQFYYGARKRAWGPFKAELWGMAGEARDAIAGELEAQFALMMQRLGVSGTAELARRVVPFVDVPAPAPAGLRAALRGEKIAASGSKETYDHVEGE
jgi:fructose/tagatose bisphosphate aldolase